MLVFRCWCEGADDALDAGACKYVFGEDLAELVLKVGNVKK